MSDVFISYASEDRERARMLASALEGRGWSVWWDRKIVPGQTFDQVIEHELETAKCVVVLWSKNSVTKEWVKNEAASAAERGALVPALIENIKIPLEFRRKQTADLISFKGDAAHGGFQGLCEGISTIISAGTPAYKISPPPSSAPNKRRVLYALGALVLVVALGLGVYVASNRHTPGAIIPPNQQQKQTSPSGAVSDQIFNRLNRDQWEGLEMLTQRKPGALAHIEKTLNGADEAAKAFPEQGRFHELKGYLLKDVYQSREAKKLLTDEMRQQYLAQARASAEQALRINPNSPSAHNLMGNVLYFERDCDGAIKEYDLALNLNPSEDYRRVIEGDKQAAVACAR